MADLDETTITAEVLKALAGTPDPRMKQVAGALIRHLHAFIREIEPTEAEWMAGIDFLTRTGKMCSDVRQEFILLSDTLGVTALVDAVNHRHATGATANSVLGPFYFENRPTAENGADISGGVHGEALYFEGVVTDTSGRPVAGALVDIWHSDGDGHYDVMLPDFDGKTTAMRALFRTGADGRFWFHSILPTSYPIPGDGPVGELMRATNRSIMRPAHIHVLVQAPGHERLTTMVFPEGDPHLASDPVFGVKASLIEGFAKHPPGPAPDGTLIDRPFFVGRYRFGLAPTKAGAAA